MQALVASGLLIEFNDTDFDNVNLEVLQDKIVRSTLEQRFALTYKVERHLLSAEG